MPICGNVLLQIIFNLHVACKSITLVTQGWAASVADESSHYSFRYCYSTAAELPLLNVNMAFLPTSLALFLFHTKSQCVFVFLRGMSHGSLHVLSTIRAYTL